MIHTLNSLFPWGPKQSPTLIEINHLENCLFVSDVHLKMSQPKQVKTFFDRLMRAIHEENIKHLFILGDLFDFFWGYHLYFYEQVNDYLQPLLQLVLDHQLKIYWIEGNHDFNLNHHYWPGLEVVANEAVLLIQDQKNEIQEKWHLSHGDLLNPFDKSYLALRIVLRHQFLKKISKLIPAHWVLQLGHRLSDQSRKYHQKLPTVWLDKMIKQSLHRFCDRLHHESYTGAVMGHIHMQMEKHEHHVIYFNLGFFPEKEEVLLFKEQKRIWKKI